LQAGRRFDAEAAAAVFNAESDLGTGRSPKKTLQIRVSRLRSAINIQSRRTPCAEAMAYIAVNRCAFVDTKFDRRSLRCLREEFVLTSLGCKNLLRVQVACMGWRSCTKAIELPLASQLLQAS
jgi:hypothetical protein